MTMATSIKSRLVWQAAVLPAYLGCHGNHGW